MKWLALVIVATVLEAHSLYAASVWLSAPKPNFPPSSLRKGSEGFVKLRIIVAKDGRVINAIVTKSSNDTVLDETARTAVLKWKMSTAAIKPDYLTKGYQERIDFKQEALLAAVYPDRRAYFSNFKDVDFWAYAPFPSYPLRDRERYFEGTVILKARIGPNGQVAAIEKLRTSGHIDLDDAAIAAVRLWRAHKEFAGKERVFPIKFVMGRR